MYSKVTLAVLAFFASAMPAGAVTASYNDGVSLYQAAKYHQAALSLAKATGAEPSNALAHYYFANALVHLGAHDEAAKEYRTSLLLEPYGTVSAFCRAALKGYHVTLPSKQDTISKRDSSLIPDTAGSTIPLAQSLSTMRQQIAREKARGEAEAASNGNVATSRTKVDFDKVEAVVQERIAALHADNTRPTFGNPYQDNMYLARREAEIRKEAKEEQELIRREAGETAARYKHRADERQKVLDDTAHSLETQMKENHSKGGVRLVSQGTDLYVRSYVSVPSRHPAPPAHQAVVRIYGHSGGPEAGAESRQTDWHASDTDSHEVSGRVLN